LEDAILGEGGMRAKSERKEERVESGQRAVERARIRRRVARGRNASKESRETKGERGTHSCPALSTPIFSTSSSVSLSPAVSLRTTFTPAISRETVTMSRVVPGMGETMAASRWER